ncbi:hypothetical protein OQA88_6145 [Cercophora sp. LCS_1]
MSPIAARAAFRFGAAAGRRQFSVISSLRGFARSFEPHPFERLPVTTNAAAADWGRQLGRVAKQGVVFFPTIFLMLGWPYLGRVALDERV